MRKNMPIESKVDVSPKRGIIYCENLLSSSTPHSKCNILSLASHRITSTLKELFHKDLQVYFFE
jgi:hypothetical protein